MKPNIHRLLELQKLLATFNQVERVTHRWHDKSYVKKNDVEHSYNLAMTAWYLARWFPDLNVNLLIKYALIHDLVEVYAGDTYIYGSSEAIESKADREAEALKRLEKEWPDFSDATFSIHAYETKADPEARFIYALDKIMPIMLIYIHDGYTWKQEDVTLRMLDKAKRDKVALSPEVRPYYEQLHRLLLSHPELIYPGDESLEK